MLKTGIELFFYIINFMTCRLPFYKALYKLIPINHI